MSYNDTSVVFFDATETHVEMVYKEIIAVNEQESIVANKGESSSDMPDVLLPTESECHAKSSDHPVTPTDDDVFEDACGDLGTKENRKNKNHPKTERCAGADKSDETVEGLSESKEEVESLAIGRYVTHAEALPTTRRELRSSMEETIISPVTGEVFHRAGAGTTEIWVDEPSGSTLWNLTKSARSSTDERDCLGCILPAIEEYARGLNADAESDPVSANNEGLLMNETYFDIHDDSSKREIQLDMIRDSFVIPSDVDTRQVSPNTLCPREQEEADHPIRDAVKLLFNNQFMKAKAVFHSKADREPLYALQLGVMASMKALITHDETDRQIAMNSLASTYAIAKAQCDNETLKRPFRSSLSQYFSSLKMSNRTGLPMTYASPVSASHSDTAGASKASFVPNGILRAHAIRGESCLLMGILQMTHENTMEYLKCGLNLRRAYSDYTIVWQEYKRMGQEYTKYMDRDTVSAIQFGIAAIHLLLLSLPPKVHKIFSTLGWKSDKQLAVALLKLCIEGKGIRAPLASLLMLAYYSEMTATIPQMYREEFQEATVDCLSAAQENHPRSCFFLYYAARVARNANNMTLSIRSLKFAAESAQGEWPEAAMKQLTDYEIALSHILQLDWKNAAARFDELSQQKYWSPIFCQYMVGASYEMQGSRTDSILAFAKLSQMAKEYQNQKTYIDTYAEKKVEFYQCSGYQDMDFCVPGLEMILLWNAFEQMDNETLEQCLVVVLQKLESIYEREKSEYSIRLRELAPSRSPPDYTEQRSILLLIQASVFNALHQYHEAITHLNWILDHRSDIKGEKWVIPFSLWEAGITSWGMQNRSKSRKLWEQALEYNSYSFQHRLIIRLNLALNRCDELGVRHVKHKKFEGITTNGRKRMPIVSSS
ncbi:uncharacterized protein BYT42DRAFT_555731 [Radiomyces spectabilis]|uniref:uncharacterized protein n=1 Tax=Radiomyces spectabilis TaxID=64574 RepID=UPI00221FEFE1|nr:uncharacterized protein BYT42DRAFT_555731 [Radiomyces spectabilis]KAI8391132.1 hypothetical protein BYT42DRAFT_555731 [Radiomyces spectabilis]